MRNSTDIVQTSRCTRSVRLRGTHHDITHTKNANLSIARPGAGRCDGGGQTRGRLALEIWRLRLRRPARRRLLVRPKAGQPRLDSLPERMLVSARL